MTIRARGRNVRERFFVRNGALSTLCDPPSPEPDFASDWALLQISEALRPAASNFVHFGDAMVFDDTLPTAHLTATLHPLMQRTGDSASAFSWKG